MSLHLLFIIRKWEREVFLLVILYRMLLKSTDHFIKLMFQLNFISCLATDDHLFESTL